MSNNGMRIIGVVVMNNSEQNVLGEYFVSSSATSGLKVLISEIFMKIAQNANLWSQEHTRVLVSQNYYYQFYYRHLREVTIFAVVEPAVKHRMVFSLLDAIQLELSTHNNWRNVNRMLRNQVNHFNDPSMMQNDKITLLQQQIDQVKDSMIDNLDQVLGRTVQIEVIAGNTDQLADAGNVFKKGTRKVRCLTFCNNLLCCGCCP